jgi:hypothetical protein
MNQKQIAREWFCFLGYILFCLLVGPLILASVFSNYTELPSIYLALVRLARGTMGFWLFALAPYLLFQLIRSVAWAFKTIRKP